MQGTAPKRPEPPIDAARAKAKARACYLQSGRIEGGKAATRGGRQGGGTSPPGSRGVTGGDAQPATRAAGCAHPR